MSIQAMNNVLEQIQFQSQQVSSAGKVGLTDSPEKSLQFSDILFNSINSINSINQAQTSAKSQAQDYIAGSSDIGLNDVMVSLQKSSLALNMGIQARNKLVNAYQEIMSMSV